MLLLHDNPALCLYLDDVCEKVELEDTEDKLLLLADEEQSAGTSEASAGCDSTKCRENA